MRKSARLGKLDVEEKNSNRIRTQRLVLDLGP